MNDESRKRFERFQSMFRLISVLSSSPNMSSHIVLTFPPGTSEDAKRCAFRAFVVRARVIKGKELRYVIIRETEKNGHDLKAYHFYSNINDETCVKICDRWPGLYRVNRIDQNDLSATLPQRIFDEDILYVKRRLFDVSRNFKEE